MCFRSEPLLLERLRKGDASAFRSLFETYWKRVHAVCRRGTGSCEDADELTQEIFRNLWEKRESLRIEGPLEHYLMRAAKYTVFNHHRYNVLRQDKLARLKQELQRTVESADAGVLAAEARREADEALRTLPEPSRSVFELSHLRDLRHKEIARILKISTKTVEYHLRTVRNLLRRRLSGSPEHETP